MSFLGLWERLAGTSTVRRVLFLAFILVSALFAALSNACGGGGEDGPFGLKSELVTASAQADALAFAPDGRLFYAEHWTGNIRIITADGKLLPDPFAHVESGGVYQLGFTGLALDPEFETNRNVYAYFLELTDPGPPPAGTPRVVRFTEADNIGTDAKIIVADLPQTDPEHPFGANGSIHFGPDGFLYVTVGDYDLANKLGPSGTELAQDLATPIGKVLRVSKEDGSAPASNPFAGLQGADPRIYAYGFHAPFDFAFHPQTGKMYGSDNSGVTCEEVNIVEPGGNYGWPNGEFPYTDCNAREQAQAIHHFARDGREAHAFDSAVGVTGMEFISGAVYPSLGDSLLICESRTQLMRRLVPTTVDFSQVASDDVVVRDCWWDVAVSPEGIIYYSNLTEIRRLLPPEPGPPAQ